MTEDSALGQGSHDAGRGGLLAEGEAAAGTPQAAESAEGESVEEGVRSRVPGLARRLCSQAGDVAFKCSEVNASRMSPGPEEMAAGAKPAGEAFAWKGREGKGRGGVQAVEGNRPCCILSR